jgi:hypothetical protein
MTVDMIQLAYYAGFAVLGWWLRHQGVALPGTPVSPPATPAAPTNTPNQQVLIDLLKSLLDRLAPPAPSTPTPPVVTGNIVHVPIEVAANVKQPSA